jgi:hypothetical protein
MLEAGYRPTGLCTILTEVFLHFNEVTPHNPKPEHLTKSAVAGLIVLGGRLDDGAESDDE